MDTINLSVNEPWAIAAAAFSNPMYLSAPLGKTANEQSTGFSLQNASSLVIAFEGTYTGQTIAHEQTLDPTGQDGWFSVLGMPATGGSSTSSGSTAGLAYLFPAYGLLHRMRMTSLSTGTIEARVLLTGVGDGGGLGGGGGGGAVGMTATAANPTYTEGATGQAFSSTLSGHLRVFDEAAVDELIDVNTNLTTPASSLPLPGLQAAADTTLSSVVKNISTATDTEIVSGTSSQTTRVYRLLLVCGGANVLTFKSASTAIMPAITFGSSGGAVTLDLTGYWWMKTATAEALNLTTTTTAAVGLIAYYQKG